MRYLIKHVLRVDRGYIPTGKKPNGTSILGKHVPYTAGLILLDTKVNRLLFLDRFNQEVYLREYFGINNLPLGNPYRHLQLDQLMGLDEFEDLKQYIQFRITDDERVFLKENKCVVKRRDVDKIREIARNSSV